MSPRIEQLTREQAARLPEWRERWLKIGLATGWCDHDACVDAALEAYRAAGLRAPRYIIWLQSPLAGALGAFVLGHLFHPVKDLVCRQTREEVRSSIRARVSDSVWHQVRQEIEDWLYERVHHRVEVQVASQVLVQVGHEVCQQVWEQVGAEIRAGVGHKLSARVEVLAGWQVDHACYGQHDSRWLACYSFFDEVCGLAEAVAPLHGLFGLAQCSWWWPFREAVLLTERPIHVAVDELGRLHCPGRAAIQYADGFGVYAWHGFWVPADAILDPESITVERIDGERDVEVRRILLERYGEGRYLEDSGAELIHADRFGELFRREMPDGEPLCMVRLENATPEADGTRRRYWLRVPPDVTTAQEAVAWTFGIDADEYRPKEET